MSGKRQYRKHRAERGWEAIPPKHSHPPHGGRTLPKVQTYLGKVGVLEKVVRQSAKGAGPDLFGLASLLSRRSWFGREGCDSTACLLFAWMNTLQVPLLSVF